MIIDWIRLPAGVFEPACRQAGVEQGIMNFDYDLNEILIKKNLSVHLLSVKC